MTSDPLQAFFDKLPREGWKLHHGAIRRLGCRGECPLIAATSVWRSNLHWEDAAADLGLPVKLARAIVLAADNAQDDDDDEYPCPGHDAALRARLLEHCRLEERS